LIFNMSIYTKSFLVETNFTKSTNSKSIFLVHNQTHT
jgi:hypothetical protein